MISIKSDDQDYLRAREWRSYVGPAHMVVATTTFQIVGGLIFTWVLVLLLIVVLVEIVALLKSRSFTPIEVVPWANGAPVLSPRPFPFVYYFIFVIELPIVGVMIQEMLS